LLHLQRLWRKEIILDKMKHKLIIGLQAVFLVIVLTGLYVIYPSSEISISGNFVKFETDDANVIMISKSPVFNDPRYIDLSELGDVQINLEPGTYYWKPVNNLIQGFRNEFVIDSEVGLNIERDEDGVALENVGDVKIKITKGDDGVMVGNIILEPDQKEEIEDQGEYIGGQEE